MNIISQQPTKKMIESAANTTMGYYNVIVQQIEQADAKTCFRIILCMIKSIGQLLIIVVLHDFDNFATPHLFQDENRGKIRNYHIIT